MSQKLKEERFKDQGKGTQKLIFIPFFLSFFFVFIYLFIFHIRRTIINSFFFFLLPLKKYNEPLSFWFSSSFIDSFLR